jgi:hypothetical protein
MVRLWLFLGLAAQLISGEGREVLYQGDLAPVNIAPTFDHGYVIAWEQNGIGVFGPNGKLLYHAVIQVPHQKYLNLHNAAVDSDGTVAVVFGNPGPGGFAVLDQSGHQVHTVLTGSYPTQICIAPDHTIWLGVEGPSSENYNLFRRYSMDGHELGEFAPTSAYPNLSSMGGIGLHAMRAAADRVVALLIRESDPKSMMEWIELDLEGTVINRPGQHRQFLPWALTDDGKIYAKETVDNLVFLDRATGTWKTSGIPASGKNFTGADGESLVFRNPSTGMYEWVAAQ